MPKDTDGADAIDPSGQRGSCWNEHQAEVLYAPGPSSAGHNDAIPDVGVHAAHEDMDASGLIADGTNPSPRPSRILGFLRSTGEFQEWLVGE